MDSFSAAPEIFQTVQEVAKTSIAAETTSQYVFPLSHSQHVLRGSLSLPSVSYCQVISLPLS